MKKTLFAVMVLVFFVPGCAVRTKGEFAFRKNIEDKYKKPDSSQEFEKNSTVNWIYKFNEIAGSHNIGVVLLKKELVWVDISSRVESVSEINKIIYGVIENLSVGTYKIILTESNQVVDQIEFTVFSEEEDYYK